MRLGVITPGFSRDDTDWCIPAVATLVQGLARQHELSVFALRYPRRRGPYRAFGAAVRPFAWGTTGAPWRPFLIAAALARIVAEGRRRRLEALHAFWADEPGYLAVLAGRLLGIPAVVSVAGGELVALPDIGYGTQLSATGRWLVRRALRRATRVAVGSRSLAAMVEPHVRAGRLVRLPLGVDAGRFSPPRAAAPDPATLTGGLRLLHVGSLVPVKDQASLLRAVALVAGHVPEIHLHVVGSGPLRPALEGLARQLGLGGKVTFHGEVRHDLLPAYYRAAHLCLVTSRFESQGMVALEAAACGRPTIGTAVGMLPEIAPDGGTVPVGDVAGLARTAVALLGDPERLERLGARCRATVRQRYALPGTVARLAELYAEAGVARGSARRGTGS